MCHLSYKLPSLQNFSFSVHITGQAALEIIKSISPNNVDRTQIDFNGIFASLIMVK